MWYKNNKTATKQAHFKIIRTFGNEKQIICRMEEKEGEFKEKNGQVQRSKNKQDEIVNAYLKNILDELSLNSMDSKKRHEFWETQPVNQFSDKLDTDINEPLKPRQPKNLIATDAFELPSGYYWVEIDINEDSEVIFV